MFLMEKGQIHIYSLVHYREGIYCLRAEYISVWFSQLLHRDLGNW